MNPFDYLKGLMPELTKSQLRDDLARIRQEISTETIPPYEEAIANGLGTRKLKSGFAEAFQSMFDREVKIKYSGNYLAGILEGLKQINENLDSIDRLIDKSPDTMTKQAITVLNINLAQLLEAQAFSVRYARRLLNTTLLCEINLALEKDEFHDLPSGDHKWMDQNKAIFIDTFALITIKRADLDKLMEEIPDLTVSEDNIQAISASAGLHKIDPLKFGLIPVRFNIFYHVGLWVAELQADRYKSAVAEREAITLRLMYLRSIDDNDGESGQLARDIEVTQSRVDKLNYRIKHMEDKWLSH